MSSTGFFSSWLMASRSLPCQSARAAKLATRNVLPPARPSTLASMAAFVANVAGVKAAMLGGHLGKINQLVRPRISARVVDQPGRQAPGAVAHALIDDFFHTQEFVRRRRPIGVPHDLEADIVVRHLVDD